MEFFDKLALALLLWSLVLAIPLRWILDESRMEYRWTIPASCGFGLLSTLVWIFT